MAEFATINCIYLLIEREYINSDQCVFKIGKTGNIQSRLTGYPKNSNILYLRYCSNKDICEDILKLKFKEIFIHRQDIGAEYFEGDYIEMIKVINSLLDNEVNVTEKLNADEQFIKNRKKELVMEELDLKKEKLVLQKQKLEIAKKKLNNDAKKQLNDDDDFIINYIQTHLKPSDNFGLLKQHLLLHFDNKKLESKLIKQMCKTFGEIKVSYGNEYWLNVELNNYTIPICRLDPIGKFIKDCIIKTNNEFDVIRRYALYNMFKIWFRQEYGYDNKYGLTLKYTSSALNSCMTNTHKMTGNHWIGLKFIEDIE